MHPMMTPLSVTLLLTLVTTFTLGQRQPMDNRGTTPDIKQIFKGRCLDYQYTKYQGVLPGVNASCTALWNSFFQAFSYQPPCAVATKQYQPFLSMAKQALPKDKVLFWSKTYRLAHLLAESGQKYVTLEDTLPGYLVNGLVWCGQSIDPGMNMTRCPSWGDCPDETSESFWAGASAQFAKQASGVVSILLDGSNSTFDPYDRNSIFAKYELPNMTKNVTLVRALVSYGLGQPSYDICDKGALADLRDDVSKQGLDFECVQEPASVLHLMCVDDPKNKDCQFAMTNVSRTMIGRRSRRRRGFNSMPMSLM